MRSACNTPKPHDSTHLHSSTSQRSYNVTCLACNRAVNQTNNSNSNNNKATNTRPPTSAPPPRRQDHRSQSMPGKAQTAITHALTVLLTHRHRAARASSSTETPAACTTHKKNGGRVPYQSNVWSTQCFSKRLHTFQELLGCTRRWAVSRARRRARGKRSRTTGVSRWAGFLGVHMLYGDV